MLYIGKRLLKIGNKVFGVLYTYAKAHKTVYKTVFETFFLGMLACVIDAGWFIRDSTPPNDSASEKSDTPSISLTALGSASSLSVKRACRQSRASAF